MVNIIPFKGYRFNSEKINDFGEVMAPPYDTISHEEQEALYTRDDYNIVRLNKGLQYQDDDASENCFTRSAKLLNEWINSQILVCEDKPSFYLYEQEVVYRNTTYSNLGLAGLLELQDLSSVNIMPCEKSREHSKAARSALLESTQANLSMINCIYMEYEKTLMNCLNEITEKRDPDMKFNTHETIIGEDVIQKVWVIKEPELITFIQNILNRQTLYIADGQTRYEVSLAYKKQCEKNNPHHTGKESYNYIMALLTNAFDDGLIQLPVHRLIKFPKRFSEDFFIANSQDYFKVEKIIVDTHDDEFVDTITKQTATVRRENRFALYCGGNYFYRLTLKKANHMKDILPNASDAYHRLDSTILTHLLLGELLNISEEQANTRVFYTTRTSHGINAVKKGEYGCMFIVNPVRAEQICGVACAHERMPEHSMFIFPKASTGVVVYKMREDVL